LPAGVVESAEALQLLTYVSPFMVMSHPFTFMDVQQKEGMMVKGCGHSQ
jgi:hypothetical protein